VLLFSLGKPTRLEFMDGSHCAENAHYDKQRWSVQCPGSAQLGAYLTQGDEATVRAAEIGHFGSSGEKCLQSQAPVPPGGWIARTEAGESVAA
jgi:hypothetical protein